LLVVGQFEDKRVKIFPTYLIIITNMIRIVTRRPTMAPKNIIQPVYFWLF